MQHRPPCYVYNTSRLKYPRGDKGRSRPWTLQSQLRPQVKTLTALLRDLTVDLASFITECLGTRLPLTALIFEALTVDFAIIYMYGRMRSDSTPSLVNGLTERSHSCDCGAYWSDLPLGESSTGPLG